MTEPASPYAAPTTSAPTASHSPVWRIMFVFGAAGLFMTGGLLTAEFIAWSDGVVAMDLLSIVIPIHGLVFCPWLMWRAAQPKRTS